MGDCGRTWQAEALEDGRLDEAERASFDRHLATCAACRAEVAALGALRDAMAALPDVGGTELGRRRARRALLAKADARLVDRARGVGRAAPVAIAIAVAAAVALVIRALPEPPPASAPVVASGASGAASSSPSVDVTSVTAAEWSEERVGASTRVTLRGGVAAFRVERVSPGARFVVTVPDGEVEARGTRFEVDVRGGRTRRVAVVEGTVEVRVAGFVAIVGPGETWTARDARDDDAGGDAAPQPTAAPSASAPTAPGPSSAPAPAPPAASAPARTAGERFGEAMAAYGAGDLERADRLFAAFVVDHPRDGRAEDATFLRVQARLRLGDRAGAAAIARSYLAAFPRGLRRPECERVAGVAAPDAGAP